MHLTSFALPLALLTSLVTASPVAIDAAKRESVPAEGIPMGAVRAVDDGSKRTAGMSKYSDFNGLTERDRAANLHFCVAEKCGGPCNNYSLSVAHNQCIATVQYQAAYIEYFGVTPLGFTVYAGSGCNSGNTALSIANNCYTLDGNAYYIN